MTQQQPISFETHPDRYRHWRLEVDGETARLIWDVQENEPFRPVELGPRDLGLYPMNQGLALLYEVEGPITVTPMKGRGQPNEAAAHQLLRRATEKHPQ